ncbi:sphingomyelin phosphodiesterase [Vibrio caribbeanicus]|uniref:Sphingomyelinase/beta-hemolysin n=1 Tax=Vibrio caribbeanicus ATCC BAA-2122 TaxID=796620 RepID=E3BEE6_9VIBR|nr:sphingomyelin phosphodiesterase [Vibrio caribbeanicus]EFP98563.1 sphingomyelinase/beta-hemolysin [Vibrio caribbeanicus ATCC BAA-2122]
MIKHIILSFCILLLTACDGSGGLPSQDDQSTTPSEQPSTPILKVQTLPTSITSDASVTVTGIAWDDTSDINDIVWNSDHLTLVSQTLEQQIQDSKEHPVHYTAIFKADHVSEATPASIHGRAISKLTTQSESKDIDFTIEVQTNPIVSKPNVTFVGDLADKRVLHPQESFKLVVNTYSKNANVNTIQWESDNKNLTLTTFDKVAKGSSDSEEEPLLLTATFVAEKLTSVDNAKIKVTVKDDGENSESTTRQHHVELRPWSKPQVVLKIPSTVKAGDKLAVTLEAYDIESDVNKVEWFTDNESVIIIPQVGEGGDFGKDSKDSPLKVEAEFLTNDNITIDHAVNIWAVVSTPNESTATEAHLVTVQHAIAPVISKPVVTFASETPQRPRLNPTKELTVTVNTYSINANVSSIKWQSMSKDLVLKNAQVISSGSQDSKEHPLSLSATFEAQDFSTPSNSQITVTVKDDANNSYPETKTLDVDLQPWSAPTIVDFHVPSEVLSGKDLDVTLIAFDQEDDIEKVEWFTDKANFMTPPGPSLVPEETHDSQQSPFTFDGDYVSGGKLSKDEDVTVWAKITTRHGQSATTAKKTVVVKQLTRPVVTKITDAFDGVHAHLNSDQPKQDKDHIILSAKANAKPASEHGEGEVKINSYYWSQSSDDPISLNIDSSPQTIGAPDSEADIPPLAITLPDTGKQGSESPTDYHISLVVVDERGVESKAREYTLSVNPLTQLRVMTANVFLINSTTVGGNAKDERVEEYLKLKNDLFGFTDVVALTEVFNQKHADKFASGLGLNYHTPILGTEGDWNLTEDNHSILNGIKSGGVMVLSRYPILSKSQHIFSSFCAEDGLAAKGFIHVRIKKDWKIYNVIATHTQADPSVFSCSNANQTRLAQLAEINDYIDRKITDKSEYVYILGDMNIDKYDSSTYAKMLTSLHAPEPVYRGMRYSWDYEKNSLAFAYNYRSSYVQNHAPQLLDHVLYDNRYAKPRYWNNVILDPVAKQRVEVTVNIMGNKDRYHYPDLSDHFPSIGFEYLDGQIPEHSYRGQNKRYNKMKFKLLNSNNYIRTGDAPDDWVVVKSLKGDSGERWSVDSYAPTNAQKYLHKPGIYPTCLLDNTYVEVESIHGRWLNWPSGAQHNYYYPFEDNASKYLSLVHVDEKRRSVEGCIENGSYVLFKDGSFNHSKFSYNEVYNGYFHSSNSQDDDRNRGAIFVVEMEEPDYLDWSDLPR